MPPVHIESIKSRFFTCGFLPENAPSFIEEKVRSYGIALKIFDTDSGGSFFYSTPFYIDLYENHEMVWIKLGLAHDSTRSYTTREMIQNGWLRKDGLDISTLQGSYSLVGFSKSESRCFLFRNLVSPINLVYHANGGAIIVADNLRLMSHFVEDLQAEESVLLQHHVHRQLFGRETYLKGVYSLIGGELITFTAGELKLELVEDFRQFTNQETKKTVTQDSVTWFFEQLCGAIGFRLTGREKNSATMFSGGVDSSTMQAAINTHPGIDFPFPTFSFMVASPGFEFEIEYAKDASQLLNTDHHFINIATQDYPDWLVGSISILGMPVHFDAPPSYYALAHYVERNHPGIKYLFNGANADGLAGNMRSLDFVQADKYSSWPPWVLNLAATLLKPVSANKSYGARTAAEVLTRMQNENSPDYPFNLSSTCDWDLVKRCFPARDFEELFHANRERLRKYISSSFISENRQTLSLLHDGMFTPGLERQLGLYCGREMWFPFTDTAVVEAVYSFDPIDRYAYGYRSKPLMKMSLESQIPASVTTKPKGDSSAFEQAIIPWMRDGSLKDLVQAIERPAYISQPDFQAVLDDPGWFTWNMLTLDLFKKYGLN